MQFSQYIRESCEIQNATTPDDYIGMSLAFAHTIQMWSFRSRNRSYRIDLNDLDYLIRNIRSSPTQIAFRSQPVTFANGNIISGGVQVIEAQLRSLLDAQNDLTPEEFYWAFEEIHPWTDGNGRVGSLLFNVLNNSILNPIHPRDNPAWKK